MIFVDVNIFMDVLSQREGWKESIRILNKVRNKQISGSISSLTVSILYYFQQEEKTEEEARREVREITKAFNIVPVTQEIIESSYNCEIEDFEDAIQYNCAISIEAQGIITRNKKHFEKHADITILNPKEFLKEEDSN